MNITCEFTKMREGLFYITSPGKGVLRTAIPYGATLRCPMGYEFSLLISQNGTRYLKQVAGELTKWDTGRLTFEIL